MSETSKSWYWHCMLFPDNGRLPEGPLTLDECFMAAQIHLGQTDYGCTVIFQDFEEDKVDLRPGDKVMWRDSTGGYHDGVRGLVDVMWAKSPQVSESQVLIDTHRDGWWSRYVLVPARVLTGAPGPCTAYMSIVLGGICRMCSQLEGHTGQHKATVEIFSVKGSRQTTEVHWS